MGSWHAKSFLSTVKVMSCEQEACVVRTQVDSDSNLTEIEKPRDEEEELPEDSQPLLKKMKTDEVVAQTVEVAAPKTPVIAAPMTPPQRPKMDPQPPWAHQKVAIPVSGDKKGTIMQSKPKRGTTLSSSGEWKECKAVETIWIHRALDHPVSGHGERRRISTATVDGTDFASCRSS